MRTTELMIEAIRRYREENAERYLDEFWRLVERRRADLFNQAFALLGNAEDAEDTVQETLRVTFSRLDSLRDIEAISRWMRAVNRKIALYVLRKRRAERKATRRLEALAAEDSAAPHAQESNESDEKELRGAVMLAVDALPDPLRVVVALRYLEGLSYEEISERIGVPLGTVKSRMFRADQLLQRRLKSFLSDRDGTAEPRSGSEPAHRAESLPAAAASAVEEGPAPSAGKGEAHEHAG
jgi:RNA polymerase sigma-70 factor (ECF subfamily)